jgi:hypothetical protein
MPTPIGPHWQYVNPQGATFTAFSGNVVRILQLAAKSS